MTFSTMFSFRYMTDQYRHLTKRDIAVFSLINFTINFLLGMVDAIDAADMVSIFLFTTAVLFGLMVYRSLGRGWESFRKEGHLQVTPYHFKALMGKLWWRVPLCIFVLRVIYFTWMGFVESPWAALAFAFAFNYFSAWSGAFIGGDLGYRKARWAKSDADWDRQNPRYSPEPVE